MLVTTFLLSAFVLQGPAKAFVSTIGEKCLAERDATITVEGNVVTINGEGVACAAEIEEIARNWEIFAATDAIVTVTGSPEALTMEREKLEAKFGKSPNPRLRFLSEEQTCRCLVIAGKLSLEAADLAQGEAPAADPASDGDGDSRKLDLIGPQSPRDLSRDQGLIWKTGPAGPSLKIHNEI